MVQLHFHKLSQNATTPTRGSAQSAGLDLASAETKVVKAGGRALVKTDLQVALPDGCYGRIAPRSGLAYKKGIDVGAGVIDQGQCVSMSQTKQNNTTFSIKC